MATPWFKMESGMVTHPKVYKLVAALNLKSTAVKPNVIAAGLVIGVWSWAAQNAVDGNLTGIPAQAIAEAAGWTKKPDVFYNALFEVGLLDREGDEIWLHDWFDYAGEYAEKEAKKKADAAARNKKYRENKRKEALRERDANKNVTDGENDALEEKREEEIREESHSFTHSREEGCETDFASHERKLLGGELGRNVVLLSDAQMEDLLDKLSLEEFNHYVSVVADNELAGKHYTKKTHYQAILDMAAKDRKLK